MQACLGSTLLATGAPFGLTAAAFAAAEDVPSANTPTLEQFQNGIAENTGQVDVMLICLLLLLSCCSCRMLHSVLDLHGRAMSPSITQAAEQAVAAASNVPPLVSGLVVFSPLILCAILPHKIFTAPDIFVRAI